MDSQVKNMVAKDIKSTEMIIKGHGKKGDKTGMIIAPDAGKIMDFRDGRIQDQVQLVIKMK